MLFKEKNCSVQEAVPSHKLHMEILGQEYVTPNMHLHGHLIERLFDYGPIYSFWLFSFERFNGLLEIDRGTNF